jgi:Fe-S-cluster-containing hydrogenase component 2
MSRPRALLTAKVLCQHFEDHTPCPEGYIQWHAWADKMAKTHKQRKCAGCGLYTIWEPRQALSHAPEGQPGDGK